MFYVQSQDPGATETLVAIKALADRYASQTDVVTAIELVNEPASWALAMSEVKQFYYDGWGTIRTDNAYTAVVIHDAFLDIQSYWNGYVLIPCLFGTLSGVQSFQ
jgi:glucan 1,3-beta-glucosidase